MVALFLTLDILEISKLGLNLNEYLTLMRFQHDMEHKSFPYIPDERFFPSLLKKGYITLKSGAGSHSNDYELSELGIRVFKGDEDLFEEFYSTFPNRVPVGTGFRPVSAVNIEGVSAKNTRAIWDRVTKNKPYLQRKIIDNLKKELVHRRNTNTLSYLHNIDTWLRQATWEKWEDIPDERNNPNSVKKL